MDRLRRLGKRKLIFLLLFTCNYMVSVWRSFLFLWVLRVAYVILLWHSLGIPYNYFVEFVPIDRDCSNFNLIVGLVDSPVRSTYIFNW